jgi:hypothetical protein
MTSLKATARLAGLLYFVMSLLMIFGYMYVPAAFLGGDAAAVARKIMDGALMYRISVLTSLVGQLLFVFVVLTLYQLFKDVDRWLARLMVALVCVGVAAELVSIASRMAPLVLLGDDDFLAVFTKPQLDVLALGFLRLGGTLGRLITSIWGLWLFPFGILAIRSRFFPRILGFLLMAAGVGYMVTCVTFIVFPAQLSVVSRVMMPLYFGELPIILWLLVMGAKAPQGAAPPA